MTDLFSISDVAEKFSMHPNTIRRWIRLGAIVTDKDENGFWIVSKKEIKKLLLSRQKKLEKINRKNG